MPILISRSGHERRQMIPFAWAVIVRAAIDTCSVDCIQICFLKSKPLVLALYAFALASNMALINSQMQYWYSIHDSIEQYSN